MSKRYISFTQFLILLIFTGLCLTAEATDDSEPLLTLSCKGSDIRDVLRGIAMQHNVNIVPDSNVVGSITIHLQNAPFEAGLATLLEANGFEYEKRGGIYFVHLKDSLAKSFEMSFDDGKLTLEAQNADIRQFLREFSKQSGLNIVMESTLAGNITAQLFDVPVEEALYSLLLANGFIVDEENGIYRIRTTNVQQKGVLGSSAIVYRNKKLSIDVRNAPVGDVISEIASQCKVNIAYVGNIQGNITMRLDGVDLEQALDTLTNAAGIAYTMVDGIYLVGDPTVRPGQPNPLLERKVIWLKHLEAQDFINSMPNDIPKTSVTVSQDRNALIVIGPRKVIKQVESVLKEIDVENPDIRSRQQTALWVAVDKEGLLTIDAKDASMNMLLREISVKKGVDMTILSSVGIRDQLWSRIRTRPTTSIQQGQEQQQQTPAPQIQQRPRIGTSQAGGAFDEIVNFRISNATLEETFDSLFAGTNYAYRKIEDGNKEFYIIGTGDIIFGSDNPLVSSKRIELKYLNAANVMDFLPVNVLYSNIVVLEDQNAIMIMGTESFIEGLEDYIAQIDSPAPQIMIEALLVEISKGNSRDLGVNWSWSDDKERNLINVGPGLSAVFDSLGGVPENFFASLSALISENKARVLANPRVATTNGLQATIKVGWTDYFETTTEIYRGDDIPVGGYTRRGFNTLESGITLDITPWVGSAGDITILVHPDIKDAKQISKEHSTIANRSLDTTVRVKDGETIVIGGLIQRNESDKETRVPILGNIPILKYLFRDSQKVNSDTELMIIVRPKLIENNGKGLGDETQ